MQFFILPDSMAGAAVAERLSGNVIPHASGRPWIVGTWSADELVFAAAGDRRVALLGCALATKDELIRTMAGFSHVRQFDPLVRTPGSYHLIASLGGRIRAQGSLSTACQIFYTRTGGVTVAADRPHALAGLTGAGPVHELLATRLLAPWPPWPLSERPLWHDVDALAAGCYLDVDTEGVAQAVRWWKPPVPNVPLSRAVGVIRDAVSNAVAARTSGRSTVSVDLSGGLDSTSLSFVAARTARHLVTTRWDAENPNDEDKVWAGRAAAMIDAEHVTLPPGEAPAWFEDLTAVDDDIEAPFAWIRTRARLSHQAGRIHQRGSSTHMTGHGSDELFFGSPLHLHTLVREQPLRSIRHVRAYRAMYRWGVADTAKALRNNRSFGQWLWRSADFVTSPIQEYVRKPDFGWWVGYRMPVWATESAVDSVRHQIRHVGLETPEALAGLRAHHASFQDTRLCGDTIRRVSRLTSRAGVTWHAPMTDDHVIEAVLAVRFEDMVTPQRYKPALTEAMRGIVPEMILNRTTKSEYSAEGYAGLRRNRQALLDLSEDMRLAELGLVDPAAFRAAVLDMHASSFTLIPLISTLACESWVRSVSATAPVCVGPGGQ